MNKISSSGQTRSTSSRSSDSLFLLILFKWTLKYQNAGKNYQISSYSATVWTSEVDLSDSALSKLQQLFTLEAAFDPPVFADQITTFLTALSSQSRIRPQGETDILAILAIDSLINNLYLESRNGETFQPRSSSFYGWMSSSQMSIDRSNVS